MEISVTNVNQALNRCLDWLSAAGIEENSRNGPVIVSPEPVLVTYRIPGERVLFSPKRDANPFFHLMESLWILMGRDDIAWPAFFNKRFIEYSDDGVTQWGAYGTRWRHWFHYDQLKTIVKELKANPESRRCVLTMWDGKLDLAKAIAGGRDVPCNTHVYFDRRGFKGSLNITVCNRSNDLIWGLAGANAVQFSMLLEYMAAHIGCAVGEYRQFTNNLHAYTAVAGDREQMRSLAADAAKHDYYANEPVAPMLMVRDPDEWNIELKRFLIHPEMPGRCYTEPFFAEVVAPMYRCWHERKKEGLNGVMHAEEIRAEDWRRVCLEWLQRRENRKVIAAAQ